VEREEPDAVFHLAGISFVPAAGADPIAAFDTNVGAAVRLLEALKRWRAASGREPRLLVIGSAEQYGRHEEADMPLREGHECSPADLLRGDQVRAGALRAGRWPATTGCR
jgi:GDP-4-dehydro-6-deoxy-D-mannose reductase